MDRGRVNDLVKPMDGVAEPLLNIENSGEVSVSGELGVWKDFAVGESGCCWESRDGVVATHRFVPSERVLRLIGIARGATEGWFSMTKRACGCGKPKL